MEKPEPICEHCKKVFSSKQKLEYHALNKVCKKKEQPICTYCNRTFCSKQRLGSHVCKKKQEPICEYCNRTFSSKQRLGSHDKLCKKHLCNSLSWHNSRCTEIYNLVDIVCYDCGDLLERCGCKEKYIKQQILKKTIIDDEFGGEGYFDTLLRRGNMGEQKLLD